MKKPNTGKTLTFSTKGRFVCLAARMEPGKQQELNKGLCSGKCALVDTNSHLLTAARGCRQHQECHLNELCTSRCAIYPLSGVTEMHAPHLCPGRLPTEAAVSSLSWQRRGAGRCPWCWHTSLGKGCCAHERELLGGRACQRSELHGKLSGERRAYSWAVVAAEKWG